MLIFKGQVIFTIYFVLEGFPMEDAYSFDYEQIIDAEKAYDLFWSGVITDKRNFQCPETNCNAHITCANIDKPRYLMKQVVNFRVVGDHSTGCIHHPKNKGKNSNSESDNVGLRNRYIEDSVDVFLFERAKKKPSDNATGVGSKDHYDIKKRVYNERKQNTQRNPEYNTIKPLVSKYEEYRLSHQLNKHFIKIMTTQVSYSQMFINFDGLNIDNTSKYDRIYFGEAIVLKPKNTKAFIIKFDRKIIKDGKEFEPSIFIADSIITSHYCKNIWRNNLNELATNKQKAMFYVYSKPRINEVNNSYLNFPITNLNYLDFRLI